MEDLLGQSEYGLIAENSKKGLYSGLKKLIDEPNFKQKYEQSIDKNRRSFSKEKRVDQTEKFFQNIIKIRKNRE